MKVTRQQVLDLYKGLDAVRGLKGAKFGYAVVKNITKLRPEIEAIKEAYDAKPEYLEYDRKRADLAKSHAIMKDGVPQTYEEEGVTRYAIKDLAKFNEEMGKLQTEYKDVIGALLKQRNEYEEMLKEDVEIDPFMIPRDYLPEDITAEQINGIVLLIKE